MNTPTVTEEEVWALLRQVHDPEYGLNLVDLGLIYRVEVTDEKVAVDLTLTTPHCPAGDVILGGVEAVLAPIPGQRRKEVRLVWEPAWTPDRLTAEGRSYLGGVD